MIQFGTDTIARTATTEDRKNYTAYAVATKNAHEATLSFADWKAFGGLSYDGLLEKWGFGEKRFSNGVQLINSDGAPLVASERTGKRGRPRSTEPREPRVARTSTAGSRRIPAMFAEGIIKQGDKVNVLMSAGKVGALRENVEATVIDAKTVQFGEEVLSFNEFGQKVVGHSAINVYVWFTINGVLLNSLR